MPFQISQASAHTHIDFFWLSSSYILKQPCHDYMKFRYSDILSAALSVLTSNTLCSHYSSHAY